MTGDVNDKNLQRHDNAAPTHLIEQLLLSHTRVPLERVQLGKDVPFLGFPARPRHHLSVLSGGGFVQRRGFRIFRCAVSFSLQERGNERVEGVVASPAGTTSEEGQPR